MTITWTTTCFDPQSNANSKSLAKRLSDCVGSTLVAAQLPDLPKVIAFRNVLIRGYATIDHQIVWDAIRDGLPRLLIALNQMLGTAPPP